MVNFRGSLIAITAGHHSENCSTCFPASVNAANYFYHFLLFAFIILKILDSHSFNCQIKNLEISGEYGF